MEYLNKISEKQTKEKREKKRKNKTLKKPQEAGNRKPPNITMEPLVSIDLPNDFDSNSSQPIFLSNFTENRGGTEQPQDYDRDSSPQTQTPSRMST